MRTRLEDSTENGLRSAGTYGASQNGQSDR